MTKKDVTIWDAEAVGGLWAAAFFATNLVFAITGADSTGNQFQWNFDLQSTSPTLVAPPRASQDVKSEK